MGPYRIEEGMDVIGKHGEKVGEVGHVVVGENTKEPRFFTIQKGWIFHSDYMIPREAVTRADDAGLHIALSDAAVREMPEYTGEAPTDEDVHRAYENLGGRREESGRFTFDSTPALGHQTEKAQGTLREREEPRVGSVEEPVFFVEIEEYLVLTPEERERRGFRNEWDYGEFNRGAR